MIKITKQKIDDMAKEIHQVIEKHIPEIALMTYDNMGYPDKKGNPCIDRITLGLTIELIKAGIMIND